MRISYSEIESRRFGLRVYRGQYDEFDTKDIQRVINENDFDIIIVRYPTSTIYEHYQLVNLEHCKTIHADSLVYYSAPLQEIEIKGLRNDLEFEVVTSESESCLDSLVETIFLGYQNHYYANPCLQRKAVTDGYIEWAKSYVRQEEGKIAWIAKDDLTGDIVAFATCFNNVDESECEGVLYGVMPKFSGRGIYADLIRFTQGYFKNMGVKKMTVSTQLQNYKVQKVWNRHGFKLDHSYETYHIINQSLWEKCRNGF